MAKKVNDLDNVTLTEALRIEKELLVTNESRKSIYEQIVNQIESAYNYQKDLDQSQLAFNRQRTKAIELHAKAQEAQIQGNNKLSSQLKGQADMYAAAADALAEDVKKRQEAVDKEAAKNKELEKQAAAMRKVQQEQEKQLAAAKAQVKKSAEFLANITGASKVFAAFSAKSILDGLFSANEQAVGLSKQFGMSMESARGVREEFENFSEANTRIDAERLGKAQKELGAAIGQNILYTKEQAADYVELTEYMGLSAQSAGKLAQLGASLGQSSEEYRGNMAASLGPLNKSLGVNLTLKDVYEDIGKMSATTLVNLGRNPQKLIEAAATARRFGIELSQLAGTTSAMLDFESSIQNELEAELLTGRELNLERARMAALRGDEVTLMQEMARQAGSISDFEKMTVIGRESLAKAFGMNVEQMSTMLMRQEAMTKLQGDARDASDAQLTAARALMNEKGSEFKTLQAATEEIQKRETAQKKFEDSVRKLKTLITDMLSKLEPVLDNVASLAKELAESPLMKWVLGAGLTVAAISPLLKTAGAVMQSVKGTDLMPMVVRFQGGIPGMGGPGGPGSRTGGFGQMLSRNIPGGAKYSQAMRLSQAGKYGLSRGMGGAMGMGAAMGFGAAGAGIQMAGNYFADEFEKEGNETAAKTTDVVSGGLQGAAYGAAIGSIIPGIGTAAGAIVGGAIGLISGGLEASERGAAKREEERKKREEEKAKKEQEQLDLFRELAAKEAKLYLDSNQVGLGLATGNNYAI